MNPVTGQLLGSGTAGLIGQAVPGTGVITNGIKKQGEGISKYNFEYPFLEVAPRVGAAYLLRPDGKWILRGAFGLFFDRVEGNYTMSQSANPPTAENTTLYYGTLQSLGQGAGARGVPSMVIYAVRERPPPLGRAVEHRDAGGVADGVLRSTPPTSGSIRITRRAPRAVSR